jgi:phosphoribosylamine-glycine ligase
MYGFSDEYSEYDKENYNEIISGVNEISKDITVIGDHIDMFEGKLVPSGERVFALQKTGKIFNEVKKCLINEFAKIKMNGLYFRNDIKKIF